MGGVMLGLLVVVLDFVSGDFVIAPILPLLTAFFGGLFLLNKYPKKLMFLLQFVFIFLGYGLVSFFTGSDAFYHDFPNTIFPVLLVILLKSLFYAVVLCMSLVVSIEYTKLRRHSS